MNATAKIKKSCVLDKRGDRFLEGSPVLNSMQTRLPTYASGALVSHVCYRIDETAQCYYFHVSGCLVQAQEQQVRAWCQELDVPLFVVEEQQDPQSVQQLFRALVSEGHQYVRHRQPGCSADVPGPVTTYRPV